LYLREFDHTTTQDKYAGGRKTIKKCEGAELAELGGKERRRDVKLESEDY